jgi:hypothetical protein
MEALDWSVDKSVKIGMVQAIEQADRLTDEFEQSMNHANDADRVLNELLYFFVRPLLVSSIFKCS